MNRKLQKLGITVSGKALFESRLISVDIYKDLIVDDDFSAYLPALETVDFLRGGKRDIKTTRYIGNKSWTLCVYDKSEQLSKKGLKSGQGFFQRLEERIRTGPTIRFEYRIRTARKVKEVFKSVSKQLPHQTRVIPPTFGGLQLIMSGGMLSNILLETLRDNLFKYGKSHPAVGPASDILDCLRNSMPQNPGSGAWVKDALAETALMSIGANDQIAVFDQLMKGRGVSDSTRYHYLNKARRYRAAGIVRGRRRQYQELYKKLLEM